MPCQLYQDRSWANWGAKGSIPHIGLDRNRASRVRLNPRGRSRHKPAESSASSFALPTIPFRSLVTCSHAAIFVRFPESFSTLLIASLLAWIFCFVFFFHNLRVYLVSADSPSCFMANRQSEVFYTTSVASTCAFGCTFAHFFGRWVALLADQKAVVVRGICDY
jgi:hypothetical protein